MLFEDLVKCGFVRARNTIGERFLMDMCINSSITNQPTPPAVLCGHPSHPPPSPSPPNIPSQIFGEEDLDSGHVVPGREHSLAGRPMEG